VGRKWPNSTVSLKLDELIRAVHAARNEMLTVEDLDDDDLEALRTEFRTFATGKRRRRKSDEVPSEVQVVEPKKR
jgi:low affinity Fe/Cu permease